MRELADTVARLLYAVRITSLGQWVLRLVGLSAVLGAGALALMWFPVQISTALFVVLTGLALWSVVRPGSLGPLLAVLVLALWWAGAGAGATWSQLGVLASLIAVFHLASAWAAAAPSYAAITPRAGGVLVRRLAVYLLVCAAAVALVIAVSAAPSVLLSHDFVWVGLGLAALVLAGVAVTAAVRSRDRDPVVG